MTSLFVDKISNIKKKVWRVVPRVFFKTCHALNVLLKLNNITILNRKKKKTTGDDVWHFHICFVGDVGVKQTSAPSLKNTEGTR